MLRLLIAGTMFLYILNLITKFIPLTPLTQNYIAYNINSVNKINFNKDTNYVRTTTKQVFLSKW